MPYIGFLRHNIGLDRLHPPSRPTSPSQALSISTQTPMVVNKNISTQTNVERLDKSVQTDVDLSAYVIVDYKTDEEKKLKQAYIDTTLSCIQHAKAQS